MTESELAELSFGRDYLFGVPGEVAVPVVVEPRSAVAIALLVLGALTGCDVVGNVAGGTAGAAGGVLGALPGFIATEVGQFATAGLASSVVLSFGSGEGLGGVFSKRGLDRALVFPMILFLAKNSSALWAVANSGRATIGAFGGLALQTAASIVKNDLTPGFFDAEGLKEKLVCAFLGGVAAQASGEANLPGVVIPGVFALATAFGGIPHFGREQHQ